MKAQIFVLSLLILCLSSFSSASTTKTVYGLTGSGLSSLNLNQAEQIYPLVSNKYDPTTNTTLKMNVTTYDLGGSTDVSNLLNVYLGSFCMTEMKQGGALHLIANVSSVLSVTRKAAGFYEVIAEEWPVGADWPAPIADFRLHKVMYNVDAVQLTVDLRQLDGIGEFGHKQYTTPITVTRTVLD